MQRFPFLLLLALATGALPSSLVAASPDPVKTRQLVAVATSDAPLAERARALQQLALVASPDAVPLLAPLLADEKLGQYARDVLEIMPDSSAGEALRNALSALKGNPLLGVINSVGLRRDPQAVPSLVNLIDKSPPDTTGAALLALGRIATVDSAEVVEKSLTHRAPEVRAAAAEAALFVAERRLADREPAAAVALYDAVRRANVPEAWRVAATRGAILARSSGGVALLVEQLRAKDEAFRDVALLTIRDLRDAQTTPTLIAELDRLEPAMQARVIAALVERGELALLPAVEVRVGSRALEVRLAAIKALAKIGGPSSLPVLLRAATEAAPVGDAALASLARIPATEANAFVVASLAQSDPALRIRLIGVLGERQVEAATPELLKLAAGGDLETSRAAFRALGLVTHPRDLPQLVRLAIAARDEATKTLADRAIVTTAMKVLEPERRADVVLSAFRAAGDPATRAALLRPLGAIVRAMAGNHDVFFAVRPALKDAAEPVRDAALRCLADWPDATPAMLLAEFANQPKVTTAQREIALGGATRLAAGVASGRERSPLNVLECLTLANRAVATTAEKLMIVSALGSVKRPEALALLQPYLEDAAVRTEAALALLQIAGGLPGPKNAALMKPLLERVAGSEKDDDVRQRAVRLAQGAVPPTKKGKAGGGRAGKAAAAVAPPPVAAGQTALFNGQDLSGWDGDPGVWRVRDGAIVGGTLEGNPRNEFLAVPRRFRNFVLRLDYKLVGTEGFVNGGVQFRSVRVTTPPNEMSGYQADIGAGHSGCLYDESRRKKFLARATDEQIKRLEKVGDWNRYEIRCVGPQVELTLNGEKTVSYVETDSSVALEGLIALQIHGNNKAEVSYRNLVIEELP